jgi:hypothetical protein
MMLPSLFLSHGAPTLPLIEYTGPYLPERARCMVYTAELKALDKLRLSSWLCGIVAMFAPCADNRRGSARQMKASFFPGPSDSVA